MLFYPETTQFAGSCCGVRYLTSGAIPAEHENPGLFLTFKEPFAEREGFKAETIVTPYGNIYVEYCMKFEDGYKIHSGKGTIRPYDYSEVPNGPTPVVDWAHHFYKNEVWRASYNYDTKQQNSGKFIIPALDGVGICIHAAHTPGHAPVCEKWVKDNLGDIVIFESEWFYNWIHTERHFPSLQLVIFDRKGIK